ncbi:PREDICTED: homocysteine S-methyltransferase 2-like [Papilio polytes]|uniref:5-methyltetrahydrofolate n=1 Tax=Papilio polytes TaxID=76194 RepID=I4DMV1_PAPPL|nr:homocysteine S-methyltransferase 2-like [Papilio polytes]XP_013134018.1 PREDICTED: homocysteine S-methyltransferase 2-like [Papilio polytes]XP_013134019.1 PREDICTED: homocysteine S-methyltransferase 2-like [Papilio polytes]XP_013134020.1 PREDICTED: homocysteine S-methyltransferase 2-like [Papilio polytes]BAM19241.1 5-methyltetrahydrofolate [Papilio polytes]
MRPSTEEGVEPPQIVVLDGGFSTQLSCHVGHVIDGDPLWSARFLHTHPNEVVNTHLDFLRAGAHLIITNTYQASVDGFVEHLGVSPEQGYELIVRAVELAKRALNLYLEEYRGCIQDDHVPLVVGSVGPYGAHLHDGSEYDGSYADTTTVQTMREWHRPRIQALVEAGVDLLALETIPCQEEAEMLCDLLREFPNVKAWLAFSCKDNQSIAHGESFQKVAKKCWEANPDQLVAVGVNCCAPSYVSTLLKGINDDRPHDPIPLIVYPNSGEKYNPQIGWIDRDKCEAVEVFIQEWLDLGVRYVGGCCRTYATDVSRIRNQVHCWRDRRRFQAKYQANLNSNNVH